MDRKQMELESEARYLAERTLAHAIEHLRRTMQPTAIYWQSLAILRDAIAEVRQCH